MANQQVSNGLPLWAKFIQQVGFPIVVAFYLLHRFEVKIDAVIATLQTSVQYQQEILRLLSGGPR